MFGTQNYTFSSTCVLVNFSLCIFGLLQCGIIPSLFGGSELSNILLASDKPPFEDADGMLELVESGRYKLVARTLTHW